MKNRRQIFEELLLAAFPSEAVSADCGNELCCLVRTNAPRFFVWDGRDPNEDSNPVTIRLDPPAQNELGHAFQANNPREDMISILRVDACFAERVENYQFNTSKKRCECVLFDDTVLCFVEIKDITMQTNKKKRKVHREDALKQLETTYNYIHHHLSGSEYDTLGFRKEAYVATRRSCYKNSSTFQNERQRFARMYGINLREGDLKVFGESEITNEAD